MYVIREKAELLYSVGFDLIISSLDGLALTLPSTLYFLCYLDALTGK